MEKLAIIKKGSIILFLFHLNVMCIFSLEFNQTLLPFLFNFRYCFSNKRKATYYCDVISLRYKLGMVCLPRVPQVGLLIEVSF